MRSFPLLALLLLLLVWPSEAKELDSEISAAYGEVSVGLPTGRSVVVCHGFGCRYRTQVTITAADRQKLIHLMAGGHSSAMAERGVIAAAIAWFARRVAPEAGTAKAVARAGAGLAGDPSQFDCIDASRNTTSFLIAIEELGLLHHHQVKAPVARGHILHPHATAVIQERHTSRFWAVDSWTHKNGELPDIMPLEQWKDAS